jgi:hypothetical protein
MRGSLVRLHDDSVAAGAIDDYRNRNVDRLVLNCGGLSACPLLCLCAFLRGLRLTHRPLATAPRRLIPRGLALTRGLLFYDRIPRGRAGSGAVALENDNGSSGAANDRRKGNVSRLSLQRAGIRARTLHNRVDLLRDLCARRGRHRDSADRVRLHDERHARCRSLAGRHQSRQNNKG